MRLQRYKYFLRNILELICNEPVECNFRLDHGLRLSIPHIFEDGTVCSLPYKQIGKVFTTRVGIPKDLKNRNLLYRNRNVEKRRKMANRVKIDILITNK